MNSFYILRSYSFYNAHQRGYILKYLDASIQQLSKLMEETENHYDGIECLLQDEFRSILLRHFFFRVMRVFFLLPFNLRKKKKTPRVIKDDGGASTRAIVRRIHAAAFFVRWREIDI